MLPYLATSLSTYYLAWDIEWAHAHGHGLLLSGQTAEALLHLIQPLQVGYGAVVSTRFLPPSLRKPSRAALRVAHGKLMASRSSLSSAPPTGGSNLPVTVDTKATVGMPLAWWRRPSPGQPS